MQTNAKEDYKKDQVYSTVIMPLRGSTLKRCQHLQWPLINFSYQFKSGLLRYLFKLFLN